MKMNIKEKKDQVTNWVKVNKGVILLGLGTVTTVVISTIFVSKRVNEAKVIDVLPEPEKEFDYGRDLDMQFVVPETGEILGKIGCCESYMNDMLDCQ